ncbi:MAG: nucleotidyltransferase family protein [Myxococcaceae bacterium]|nr:nucleotidyltransferase family protein [Myxococcaceae bacterium]
MSAPSLLDLFRILSSFSPPRVSLRSAPWDEYVDWAIAQGLAPLAAYNLEYRLTGGGAPEWARDRLLSVYQGSVNDNVMKLVSFKRAVDDLEGRRILLFGGASFAEAVYPHVAFRPVPEIRLRVNASDVAPFAGFLRESSFQRFPERPEGPDANATVLSDGHAFLLIFSSLLGPGREEAERALVERALPMKVYGPSVFRVDLEDSILLASLEQARAGFDVPFITFVDLRELVTGASSMSGPLSRPPDAALVRARAKEWRMERALYASLSILIRLFPDVEPAARPMLPSLRPATRALLDRLIVEPVSQLGRVRSVRGMDRLRRLLTGSSF